MKKLSLLLIAFITVLSFSSCEKDDPEPDVVTTPTTANGKTVTPTDDVAILYGNELVIDVLSNDGIDMSDVDVIGFLTYPSGSNFTMNTTGGPNYDLTGKVNYINYTGDSGTSESITIRITTTSGYLYDTKITVTID